MNYHIKYLKIIKNYGTRASTYKHIAEIKAYFKQRRDFVRACRRLVIAIRQPFIPAYKDAKAKIEIRTDKPYTTGEIFGLHDKCGGELIKVFNSSIMSIKGLTTPGRK